jgi:TPR repeat protein
MRISDAFSVAAFAAALGVAGPVAGFEIKDLTAETPPAEAFTYGLNQYKTGDKQNAIQAFDFAAQKGIAGAQWKLGNMYAEGDGVPRDEYKAFELFSEVAANASDEDSPAQSAPFVSSAFNRLGTYYRLGIPDTKVKPDYGLARQFYYNAASIFGNADAQLNLARMYVDGQGGDRDLIQAAKWANLAADKGNAEARALAISIALDLTQAHLDGKGFVKSAREAANWARVAADYGSIDGQALLGHILFEGDGISRRPIDGLMLLTVALIRSGSTERWIVDMHEEARSAATPDEWNAAKQRAEQWIAANPTTVATTATSAAASN